jgi:drug/metabolite transporter (DMT)-like permease
MNLSTQAVQAFHKLRHRAWWPRALGLVAVLLFALTIPMTRMANGSMDAPQWPPLFVASARGALAGCLAFLHLWWAGAAWPGRAQRPWLLGVVLGGVLGFPLCMGWAVRIVPASHAAVLMGLLPIVTAALAAWWLGHRPRLGFWLSSLFGAALIAAFVLSTSSAQTVPEAQVLAADASLLLAILGSAVAYVAGARLSRDMPSAHVMSWSLVLAWPLSIPLAWWCWPEDVGTLAQAWHRIDVSAWIGLLYVAVFSTWLGFFFWYAALARDAMRVSQVQLLQPFLAIGMSGLLLGESVPAATWLFALAVLMTVGVGQRLAAGKAKAITAMTAITPTPTVTLAGIVQTRRQA